MAFLTVNLSDPEDVEYGMAQLRRVAARHQSQIVSGSAIQPATVVTEEEVQAELNDLLGNEIKSLLDTKTGRLLIVPFTERFTDPATIEEIAQILECEPGVDRVRKAHSLMAGLGRWETPRQIKIFESLGGRPQRYRMNPDVLEIVERERNERANRAE
jgi:cell division protein FtsX